MPLCTALQQFDAAALPFSRHRWQTATAILKSWKHQWSSTSSKQRRQPILSSLRTYNVPIARIRSLPTMISRSSNFRCGMIRRSSNFGCGMISISGHLLKRCTIWFSFPDRPCLPCCQHKWPSVYRAARPTTLVQVECTPSVPAADAVKPTMQEQHGFRGPSNNHSDAIIFVHRQDPFNSWEDIGQQQPLHYDRSATTMSNRGSWLGQNHDNDRLENQSLGSSMFRQAWRTRNTSRVFFSWFLIVPFRARWATPCTSRLSSSAPQSHGLCGCTPACSHWTVLRLLSLQGSLGLDHTAETAKQVRHKLVQ